MPAFTLSADETRRFRILSQGLVAGGGASEPDAMVLDIVRRTGGIQAQDMNVAPLQVRVRSSGLTSADVMRAHSHDRSIVRTWVMRGTLHLIPAEDHRWMTALLGPSAFSAGRGRRRELGLDENTLDKAHERAIDILTAEGPLTRQQLGERLAAHDIPVENQALHHIVRSGGFLGITTHGPLLDGKTETFVAADSWLAGIERPELTREEALARLAGRYIRAFGPSTPRDFAVWSGLPLRDARAGWESISTELVEVDVEGEGMWMVEGLDSSTALRSAQNDRPVVRLLGFFDTYLLGYRGRGLAVAPDYLSRVNAGGGMIRPVVTIDGLAVATWSWTRLSRGRGLEIAVEPFEGLEALRQAQGDRTGAIWEAVRGEVSDIGRFLGVEAVLGG